MLSTGRLRLCTGGSSRGAESAKQDETSWSMYDEPLATAKSFELIDSNACNVPLRGADTSAACQSKGLHAEGQWMGVSQPCIEATCAEQPTALSSLIVSARLM